MTASTSRGAFYNENDPFAAAWLRELIAAGQIAPGVVDERSIEDIAPVELSRFAQCHFFAGIGVWSYALRLAGWPDERPIWTGSCPCQPFSAAGKGEGFADERHLWPFWHWLIAKCRPAIVLGEQVASADGLHWLDLVSADLEGEGYAFGAVDLCAAGVGSPCIRQRLWFVGLAIAELSASPRQRSHGGQDLCLEKAMGSERVRQPGGVGLAVGPRLEGHAGNGRGAAGRQSGSPRSASEAGASGGLDGAGGERRRAPRLGDHAGHVGQVADAARQDGRADAADIDWRVADWLYCRDGVWRPVEPGTFPLAARVAGRVGRLRGYGNALNAQTAKVFIEAVMGK